MPRRPAAKKRTTPKPKATPPPPPDSTVPEKVAQPHGGALLPGGVPGHKGGGGRPRNAIRTALANVVDEHGVKLISDVLSGQEPADLSEKLAAFDKAAKYGLGTTKELSVELVRDKVGETLAVLRQHISADVYERLMPLLAPIWQ